MPLGTSGPASWGKLFNQEHKPLTVITIKKNIISLEIFICKLLTEVMLLKRGVKYFYGNNLS